MNDNPRTETAIEWNSAQYLLFEQERTRPSKDLAARIEQEAPAAVLDVGCGPGNSTNVLRERFPNAAILGIDSSRNMLEQARKKYPELAFEQLTLTPDCTEITGSYDVIFSNACLQWIPNHKKLFPSLFSKLKPGGVLAIQIPMTSDMPISAILREMTDDSPWSETLRTCRTHDLFTHKPEEYYDILSGMSDSFALWQTSYLHVMDGCAGVVNWYCGSRLRPYLAAFSREEEKAGFLADVERQPPAPLSGRVFAGGGKSRISGGCRAAAPPILPAAGRR